MPSSARAARSHGVRRGQDGRLRRNPGQKNPQVVGARIGDDELAGTLFSGLDLHVVPISLAALLPGARRRGPELIRRLPLDEG